MEPVGFPLFPIVCMFSTFFIVSVISLSFSIRIVPEEKRLALYRLGRYLGDKGPGLVFLIPVIDRGILKDAVASSQSQGQNQGRVHAKVMHGWGGQTVSRVFRDGGQVLLDSGEKVDAISDTPIAEGRPVRVRRVILDVEAVE